MGLQTVFILLLCLILLRLIPSPAIRRNGLTILSVISVFWMQPIMPIREFDFYLPLATIVLALCCWAMSCRSESFKTKQVYLPLILIVGTILLIASTRFISYDGILTAARPPRFLRVCFVLLIACMLIAGFRSLSEKFQKQCCTAGIVILISILIFLKLPIGSTALSKIFRLTVGQSPETAAASDIRWLGFSYIAFRLLSVSIEAGKGRKFVGDPGAFLCYVCFPPSLSAGPIDRFDRFSKDLQKLDNDSTVRDNDWIAALLRIGTGLFKKFILADSMGRIALSSANAGQFVSAPWAWAALFLYSFQIYFDFSGYSDIAIGLGNLIGIHLPENFNHPYRKPDIAKFWNNWHMTLTQWIRSYVFNPMTRSFRSNKEQPMAQWLMVLITQNVTMILIGAWHGLTINFLIWGLWHGIGLFVHQEYSGISKRFLSKWETEKPVLARVYMLVSTAVTFLYVMLGWVWFVLPDFSTAISFFGRLFG